MYLCPSTRVLLSALLSVSKFISQFCIINEIYFEVLRRLTLLDGRDKLPLGHKTPQRMSRKHVRKTLILTLTVT